MDSTLLRQAYDDLTDAARTVVEAGGGVPPTGEWDARQLLAHLVAVDAGVLRAVWSVVAGTPATFDNRSSLDLSTLARIGDRLGDPSRLADRVRVQGGILCRVVEQLTEAELDTGVMTVLVSGPTLLVDQPVALRDLVRGLAEDHLPRHRQQLMGLLPPA